METINRVWRLARRPEAALDVGCFTLCEEPLPLRPGGTAGVLVQWELFLCAPTIRNWISGNRDSYHPVVEPGEPVLSPAVGRIVASDRADLPVGQRLWGVGSWQDFQWIDPADFHPVPPAMSSVDALGVFGLNALTAYCGLARFGLLQDSETLLVSGAAGSVGSVVAQIGRIRGCRVVGIAGDPAKLEWLREECRIADLIDYKTQDIERELDRLLPEGIDVFFDNVGGAILQAAVARMRPRGRVVLCGQIEGYDRGAPIVAPPLDMMRIIYGEIRLNGFLVTRHADLFQQAMRDLAQWRAEGRLAHREDVRTGMAELPRHYGEIFAGANIGTLLVRVSEADGRTI